MREKSIIIIALIALLCAGIICGATLLTQENNKTNNTTNNTTNVTVNETLNQTNNTNNTTEAQQQSDTKSQSTKKSTSKDSSDDGYHYSAQHGAYIKEWEDSSGSHMKSRDGKWEAHYNEKTGKLREKTPYDGWTSTQMK